MSEQGNNQCNKAKSIINKEGLIKPWVTFNEMPDYSLPAEIKSKQDGGLVYFPPATLATRNTSDDGTKQILINPIRKGIECSQVPDADVAEAFNNTIHLHKMEAKREIYRTPPASLNCGNIEGNNSMLMSGYIRPPKPLEAASDDFTVIDSNIYIFDESRQARRLLCNYNLAIVCREDYYENQKSNNSSIVIDIHMKGKEPKRLRLSTSDIEDIAKKVSAIIPEAYTSYEIPQSGKKLAHYLRIKLKDIPVLCIQKACGWILWNGKNIFSHDNHIPVDNLRFLTGKKIESQEIATHDIGEIFTLILKLAEPKKIAPMLGTCLLGLLSKLFTDAGEEYAPRFVLAIIGKSGSLKTAVSKVLFSVYNTDSESTVPASFQDTVTSLEMRFQELQCVPILVDDYYNLGNAGKKGDMSTMLETLIRFIGDGIGKNRSNSKLENIKGNRPTGTVVLTGEATTGQHSMLLRCLTVYVDRNSFDGGTLRIFQQNKTLLSTLLHHFVMYLELHYDAIVHYIANNFQLIYDNWKGQFQDARPVYQYIQLQLAFSIFDQFLIRLSNSNAYKVYIDECIAGCQAAVHDSQEFASRNASEAQYILVFYELIGKEQIRIADNKDIYQKSVNIYDGFEEDGFYWVSSSDIYIKSRKYLVQQGYQTLDENTATQTFFKAGLLDVEIEQKKDGTSKTLYGRKITINGQRKRMLKISKQGLNEFIHTNL